MGKERTTTEGTSQQQTTVQETPEAKRQNQLLVERGEAAQAGTLQADQNALSILNQLLTGQDLPGFLQQLPGGISPQAIGTQAARLASQNMAGFQSMGIADSGPAFKETAGDIASRVLLPAEQFNIQNMMQLLNQAIGGQAQVQAPIQAAGSQLSQNLAGLRGSTTTGATSSTVTGMNPFLKSFQTSLGSGLGQTIGSPSFKAGPFGF